MSAHTNEITFTVSDDGTVIIQENGDVITPADLAGMLKDARAKHSQLAKRGFGMSSHVGYFDNCPTCRKWAVAERMCLAAK